MAVARSPERALRRRRRDDVRARLIAALGELVEDAPFSDLTIDGLARRAGLSRSAFYFYFRDKHDLLMAAAAEVAEDLYGEADRWWHGEGELEPLVRDSLAGVAAVYASHGRLLAVAVEVSTYDAEVGAFWRTVVDRFVEQTAARIAREQELGHVRPLPARPTAEALVWMAERCLWLFVASGERPVQKVVDQLADVWLATLGIPAGS
jgi:AcrR family transcriptional regulator